MSDRPARCPSSWEITESKSTRSSARGSTAVVPGWFAVGDLTGDGLAALVASEGLNAPTSLKLHVQLPAGEFAAPVELGTGDRPQAMQVTDIDGDGDQDLLVLHAGDGIGLYLRDADALQPEVLSGFYGGVDLAVGDLNSDGCNDVAYAVANGGLMWQYGVGCQQPPAQLPMPEIRKGDDGVPSDAQHLAQHLARLFHGLQRA